MGACFIMLPESQSCLRVRVSHLQESKDKLFEDYVELGGEVDEIIARFEARVEESQQSKTRWGFRPEKWLQDRHGDRKAKLLVEKKASLGLLLNYTNMP